MSGIRRRLSAGLVPAPPAFMALLLFLVFLHSGPALLAREKTDVVVLKSGIRMVVEIEQLDRGRLRASTDEMGTVYIEWDKVVEVSSQFWFDVETETGERHFGVIEPGPEKGTVVVTGEGDPVTLELIRVVKIFPLEESFWRRVKGNIDLGYTVERSEHHRQVSFGFDAGYRTQRLNRRLYASSHYSRRDDASDIERKMVLLSITRFDTRRPRWFYGGMAGGQQNNELGLDYRVMAGVNIGRSIVQTNNSLFGLSLGVLASQEQYSSVYDGMMAENGGGGVADDPFSAEGFIWEGIIGTSYETFRYDSPKLNISTTLLIMPGLTISGRIRGQLNGDVRYEVFSDFFIGMKLFDYYDSEPPVAGVEKHDYGTSFTVGWSFD